LKYSINEFSTLSFDIPIMLAIRTMTLTQRISVECDSVNLANIDVIKMLRSFFPPGVSLGIRTRTTGKSRKVTTNDTTSPSIIIRPNMMTGSISQKARDPKPAIVVIVV